MDGDEYFHFLRGTWNITDGLARAARAALTPRVTDVQCWFQLLPLIGIDRDRLPTVDLDNPLLCVSSVIDPATGQDDGPFLVDGWHRLAQAREKGINWLPVLLLGQQDSTEIMTRWWK